MVHSIGLERVAMVFGLLLMVLAVEPLIIARLHWDDFIYIPGLLVAAGLAGIVVLVNGDTFLRPFRQWRAAKLISSLSADARLVFLRPRSLVSVFAIVILSHLNFAVSAWWIARALHLDLTLLDCVALIPLVTVMALLPISIGGWGIREGTLVALLGTLGIPAAGALAMSILFGLIGIAASLPGAVMLWSSGYKIGAMTQTPGVMEPESQV